MTPDQCLSACLAGGQRIMDGDDRYYEIDSVHAQGATCIVYKGHAKDGLPVYIKELCPQSANLTRNADGSLATEHNHIFEQVRARFERAYQMQRDFYLREETRNVTSTPAKLLKDNNTDYIIMPIDWGSTLHEQMKDQSLRIKDLLEVLISVASTLAYYHQQKYFHLDIKPENIFALPETKQIAKLFDFDTVVHEKDLHSGAVQLSYSEGFTAPEQKNNKRRLIDQRADFFAIGAILFHYIGETSPNAHANTKICFSSFFQYEVDANHPLLKDLDPKLAPKICEFFRKTIQLAPAKRYQTDDELLCALKEMCALADPLRIFLQPTFQQHNAFFVGRTAELQQIGDALETTHCVVLRGIGGIGKSTLAREYAAQYKAQYDTILFAPYQGSLKEMITSDALVPLHGVSAQSFAGHEAGYYPYKLKKLQELVDERTLFIIDGLDNLDDENLYDVLALNCTFLLTSRCDFNVLDDGDLQQIELNKLAHLDDAYRLFAHHYQHPISDALKAQILQVIEKVDRHPLILELLAKSLSKTDSHRAAQIIAQFVQDDTFVFASERIRYGKMPPAPAQNIIQKIFDVSGLSQAEQTVLMHLTILPSGAGFNRDILRVFCALENFNEMNDLEEKGWISRQQERVFLHQVISDTLFKTFAPTLEMFYKPTMDVMHFSLRLNQELPVSLAHDFTAYLMGYETKLLPPVNEPCPAYISLYQALAVLHTRNAAYAKALTYQKRILQAQQVALEEKSVRIDNVVKTHCAIADLLRKQLDTPAALSSLKKALALQKKQDQYQTSLTTALIYHRFSEVYSDLHCSSDALDYCTKGLAIRAAQLDEHHADIGASYLELGKIYYTIALSKYFIADAKNAKQPYPSNAEFQQANGKEEFYRSGDYLNKAITIFSDFVNQPLDAATASMHLALGLQMCGQEDDACEVASIALEDYLVYLGENHPDVAQAHLFLASIYSEKDLATCITMIEKALTVRTNLFGELHPQVAACYSQLSATYLADFSKRPSPYSFDQAIAHAKQALDVHLALPESEHSMRADCYYRLEQIYTTGAQKSSQYNNYSSLIQFYRRKAAEAYQAHLLWKNSLLTPTSNPQKPKRKPRPKPQKKRKK